MTKGQGLGLAPFAYAARETACYFRLASNQAMALAQASWAASGR